MARITASNPPGVRPPATRYSLAVEVSGEQRRIVIAGQVGVAPDGGVHATAEAQVAQVFANLTAILAGHGMTAANVIRTTVYLTDRSVLEPFRIARDAYFAAHAPASTLLFVAGLVDPRLMVEVEAEAVA